MIFEGHPSWRSVIAYYAKGVLLAALVGAAAALVSWVVDDEVQLSWVVAAVAVALVIVIVVGWIKRLATTYTITNRRLHIQRGIVARRTQEAQLSRVQNVNTQQSVMERLLRVGTVDFDTASADDTSLLFEGVASPTHVVQAVDQAQREAAAEDDSGPPSGGDRVL